MRKSCWLSGLSQDQGESRCRQSVRGAIRICARGKLRPVGRGAGDFLIFSRNTFSHPAANNGFLTYDNLFWPGGSPPTATDYPIGGGFLDIYGLLFDIGDGRVVNFWNNGDPAAVSIMA